jgi:hypothetical protein
MAVLVEMHHAGEPSLRVSAIVIEGLVLELLANVAREPSRRTSSCAPSLDVAFQQIQDCYRNKLTVQGIASLVGRRALVLGRPFRKAFGCRSVKCCDVGGSPGPRSSCADATYLLSRLLWRPVLQTKPSSPRPTIVSRVSLQPCTQNLLHLSGRLILTNRSK